ncbi:MAG: aminotransferase class I/II-fold pyridoxal phosphate-dependent enzyme [bacterium]
MTDFATRLVQFDASPNDRYRPSSSPIYQTSTFRLPGPLDYTRSGNPTRSLLETQLARLEGGACGLAFSSGMAAITAVCDLLASGDGLLASEDLYGGSHRLLSQLLTRRGVTVDFVDTSDLEAVAALLGEHHRLVLVETPSNPFQRISDLAALANLAHDVNAWLAVDNSFLSPYLQNPLALGADLVIQSGTKFLCGHSNVTAGGVVSRTAELGEKLAFIQNAIGNGLSPFESWLLLDGMKTLALRLDRQQESARWLASWLQRQPAVRRVYYPDLPEHPGRELHRRQARGSGAVISFELDSAARAQGVLDRTRRFACTVSFGAVHSSLEQPALMSHASVPEEASIRRLLTPRLLRMSVGIESLADLQEDLTRALRA